MFFLCLPVAAQLSSQSVSLIDLQLLRYFQSGEQVARAFNVVPIASTLGDNHALASQKPFAVRYVLFRLR
jgi:hypothetical protein